MWSLADASPARLSELARELNASGRWTSFLTPQEHQFLEVALNAKEHTWALFLEGRVPCQLRISAADDATPVTIDVDPVALAFRVRYMLWDTQLDRLGDTETSEPLAQALPPRFSEAGRPELSSQAPLGSRGDEDDYDDEEEDDHDDGAGGEPASGSGAEGPSVLIVEAKEEDSEPDPRGRQLTVQNCSKMYHTFESDRETLQRHQQLQASDEQIESPNEGFNGSGAVARATSETSQLASLAKNAQFGSASLSLKHLLGTIESKRSELHVTDIELRNLISDVRKNRSKWASEDRIGQEELYEACDKVVQELRNTTEHSTAFLNKVNKRDAPNYYQIIQNPMDLNTVSRKLRMLHYNSKDEFVDDLNLIWQNCLTYNSDPRHFLRAHAIAMRKKTATLSPLIPDVKIRDRAEVEAEAEEHERLRGLESNGSKRKAGDGGEGGKGQKRKLGKAPATTMTSVNGDGLEKTSSGDAGNTHNENESPRGALAAEDSSTAPSRAASVDHVSPAPASPRSASRQPDGDAAENTSDNDFTDNHGKKDVKWDGAAGQPNNGRPSSDTPNSVDAMDVDDRHAENGLQPDRHDAGQKFFRLEVDSTNPDDKNVVTSMAEDYYAPDVETAVWNTATKRRRLECITNRQALFTENKLQMDAPIELRRPGLMARFENAIKSEDTIAQNAGISLLSVDPGEEPFLIEYEVNAGLPAQPLGDQSSWLTAPLPHPNELAPTRYLAQGTMSELVNRNLNEMQIIRRLCAKILYIRDLQNGQVTQAGDATTSQSLAASSSQEYPEIHEPEADISSRLPGATPLDSKASYAALHHATAKLAMHAGFEAAQPAAVDVLVEVAGDYLSKLGQTLVAHLEAPGSSASFSSILKGSLCEMGLPSLDHLSRYISDDIVKQGKRLSTFRSRLNTTLVEILRPEVDRYNDEQFNDNSDQFVMGQFSNELGDDYFGFKELGLERELGVANIAIPFHLLRQRLVADQSAGLARPGSDIDAFGLEVPEYSPLTLESINQIPPFLREGLIRVLPKTAKVLIAKDANRVDDAPPRTEAEEEERANSIDALNKALAKAATQASAARSKLPASGKLPVRKKNFEKAYKRRKPVIVKAEEPEDKTHGPGDDSEAAVIDTNPEFRAESSVPTPNDQRQGDTDNGNLPFDDAQADAQADSGFNLEDNLTTGSLMLDGDNDGNVDGENDGDLDGGDIEGAANDPGEVDDLDMSIPGLDF